MKLNRVVRNKNAFQKVQRSYTTYINRKWWKMKHLFVNTINDEID